MLRTFGFEGVLSERGGNKVFPAPGQTGLESSRFSWKTRLLKRSRRAAQLHRARVAHNGGCCLAHSAVLSEDLLGSNPIGIAPLRVHTLAAALAQQRTYPRAWDVLQRRPCRSSRDELLLLPAGSSDWDFWTIGLVLLGRARARAGCIPVPAVLQWSASCDVTGRWDPSRPKPCVLPVIRVA